MRDGYARLRERDRRLPRIASRRRRDASTGFVHSSVGHAAICTRLGCRPNAPRRVNALSSPVALSF